MLCVSDGDIMMWNTGILRSVALFVAWFLMFSASVTFFILLALYSKDMETFPLIGLFMIAAATLSATVYGFVFYLRKDNSGRVHPTMT